jgi:hypothetical protein
MFFQYKFIYNLKVLTIFDWFEYPKFINFSMHDWSRLIRLIQAWMC